MKYNVEVEVTNCLRGEVSDFPQRRGRYADMRPLLTTDMLVDTFHLPLTGGARIPFYLVGDVAEF